MSAVRARKMVTTVTTSPKPAPRVRRTRRTNVPRSLREPTIGPAIVGRTAATLSMLTLRHPPHSGVPNAWVEVRVEQVRQQVAEEHRDRQNQHHALEGREVAKEDRVGGQAAQPGQG